jgi:lactate racemase
LDPSFFLFFDRSLRIIIFINETLPDSDKMDDEEIISILDRRSMDHKILSYPEECPPVGPEQLVKESFLDHFGNEGMRSRFKGSRRIGIIVNDRNRPTPTHLVLEHLMDNEGWILDRTSVVAIATGSHKEPTADDLRTILGRAHDLLIGKVHIHRSRLYDEHVPYGMTRRGTPLAFDRALEGCDDLILINSVEPHYFAGFTGGRKSIIPGIASYGTIEHNHRFALDEGSSTTSLRGNPVHEDMMEACGIYLNGKTHLSVQIVQAPGRLIADMFIGDIERSFNDAVIAAKRWFSAPIERLYDIVIVVARPPMDRTLYQAQKAIEHGRIALKEGGTIILIADCSEGIGQSTFWDLLTASADPDDVMMSIEKGYKLGYHKAARIVQLARTSSIFMVSSIPGDTLKRGFITGFKDLDSALERALKGVDGEPDVLLIPDATVTVPMISGGSR